MINIDFIKQDDIKTLKDISEFDELLETLEKDASKKSKEYTMIQRIRAMTDNDKLQLMKESIKQ